MKFKVFSGFSLIELMVVVAVVGILAAIAIPAYQRHVYSAHRTGEAIPGLLQIQASVEESRAQNGIYPATTSTPATANYNYSYVRSGSNYTITATATGNQTADAEDGVSCGTLTLDNVGTKAPSACWMQ